MVDQVIKIEEYFSFRNQGLGYCFLPWSLWVYYKVLDEHRKIEAHADEGHKELRQIESGIENEEACASYDWVYLKLGNEKDTRSEVHEHSSDWHTHNWLFDVVVMGLKSKLDEGWDRFSSCGILKQTQMEVAW